LHWIVTAQRRDRTAALAIDTELETRKVTAIKNAKIAEAGVLKGRRVTSYHSITTDIKNAGALWEDAEVVVDEALITSRSPDDLDAFCAKIIEEVTEGRHERGAA
jgi:putative intracellular protease/amidase